MSKSSPTNSDRSHTLRCLEVWGGNRAIQTGLSLPGIDAWISSTPHNGDAAGGDVYFLSTCGAGRISRFALADITGHGQQVGDVGARLRRLMRKYIRVLDQREFAAAINGELTAVLNGGRFATALIATYFAPTRQLVVSNLGHPRALWFHSGEKTWTWLNHYVCQRAVNTSNLPLGITEDGPVKQFSVEMDVDDLVVLYTDALSEARNDSREMLGDDGVLELVKQLPIGAPAAVGQAILSSVAAFRGQQPARDDETILVMHHTGNIPPQQSLTEKLRVIARMLGCGVGGD